MLSWRGGACSSRRAPLGWVVGPLHTPGRASRRQQTLRPRAGAQRSGSCTTFPPASPALASGRSAQTRSALERSALFQLTAARRRKEAGKRCLHPSGVPGRPAQPALTVKPQTPPGTPGQPTHTLDCPDPPARAARPFLQAASLLGPLEGPLPLTMAARSGEAPSERLTAPEPGACSYPTNPGVRGLAAACLSRSSHGPCPAAGLRTTGLQPPSARPRACPRVSPQLGPAPLQCCAPPGKDRRRSRWLGNSYSRREAKPRGSTFSLSSCWSVCWLCRGTYLRPVFALGLYSSSAVDLVRNVSKRWRVVQT